MVTLFEDIMDRYELSYPLLDDGGCLFDGVGTIGAYHIDIGSDLIEILPCFEYVLHKTEK